MISKVALLFLAVLCSCEYALGQTLDLSTYEVLSHDTILDNNDFISKIKLLSAQRVKTLVVRPIADGQKNIYYLNGVLAEQGEFKLKQREGRWTFWHSNGKKAREGNYNAGKREGVYTYWYDTGNLRGSGGFKNDKYEGKWLIYKPDGSLESEQFYVRGEQVK